MNKVGIRLHDFGKSDEIDLANKVKDIGFDGIQLVLKKAFNYEVDMSNLNNIQKAFKDIDVMMMGAYFNMIHPDVKKITDGITYFKEIIEVSSKFNCKYVGTETGSLMGEPWGYVLENRSDESFKNVLKVFKELTEHAKKHDVCVAVEGAHDHVIYSPKRLKELSDSINSDNLKVTIDLYNFLSIDNYNNYIEIFEESIKLLKDKIVIFHLKDFIIKDNKLTTTGLGKGYLNYKYIIKRIKEETPNAYLIFEGVPYDDIKSSYTYIKELLEN